MCAARQLSCLGLTFPRISLGSWFPRDVLEQLSAESGASIESSVHKDRDGKLTVFESVEWRECGITISAVGTRPYVAGDEALRVYAIGGAP